MEPRQLNLKVRTIGNKLLIVQNGKTREKIGGSVNTRIIHWNVRAIESERHRKIKLIK